jgi:hypothetical protein
LTDFEGKAIALFHQILAKFIKNPESISSLLLNQALFYSSEYSAIGGVHLELIKIPADLVRQ